MDIAVLFSEVKFALWCLCVAVGAVLICMHTDSVDARIAKYEAEIREYQVRFEGLHKEIARLESEVHSRKGSNVGESSVSSSSCSSMADACPVVVRPASDNMWSTPAPWMLAGARSTRPKSTKPYARPCMLPQVEADF